ncbi:MAG: phosphoribosylanthranilate isomerase [Pirellulaceae bacterium]|nr:phosphoribosylanthranilate isomerase [Planctomycetales bacterium]
MFRIKFCGITSVADVAAAAAAGADAVGLNFYEKSPRSVDLDTARLISDAVPSGILRIGVFVNAGVDVVRHTSDAIGLDAVQLHGDEPAAFIGRLNGLRVIRAFRARDPDLSSVRTYLEQCRQLDCLPDAVLVDAYQPGQYGGTGHVANWQALVEHRDALAGLPLLLAGGLTAENVAQAISLARPDGVDTASGVESDVARKDPEKMRQFVSEAQLAWATNPAK